MAPFLKVYQVGVYSMIAPGYKVINNDCPEGATSSGRSPGRGVDSYTVKFENLSLTFVEQEKIVMLKPVQHLTISPLGPIW
jgi:hypothetical protein